MGQKKSIQELGIRNRRAVREGLDVRGKIEVGEQLGIMGKM